MIVGSAPDNWQLEIGGSQTIELSGGELGDKPSIFSTADIELALRQLSR